MTYSTDPAAPTVGQNTIELHLLDEAGADVVGAEMEVDTLMSAHGHGAASVPTVTEVGDGIYRVDALVFQMPGEWLLTFFVTTADQQDELALSLEVR